MTLNLKDNNKELYAIIIMKNKGVFYRQFFNGKTENDFFNIQSVTKSIVAILIGIAIDKGFIANVD
jgi:CubicO group peptidase (beta-lactamase class C family)